MPFKYIAFVLQILLAMWFSGTWYSNEYSFSNSGAKGGVNKEAMTENYWFCYCSEFGDPSAIKKSDLTTLLSYRHFIKIITRASDGEN